MTLKPPKPEPTVVGIGASAGGLAAIRTFLDHVPANCGLAFVIVVHLSPDHESHLAELLQPHVHFPVQQVNETIALEPNNVYVIPPNANLSAIDTHLRLTKLEERRQERAPIDHFFRTLAAVHDGHAIAVVLTGTGSDGTLGVKDVKAHGGLVIVQDPNEAEFDGMPQSAIATGLVDFILPLAEIPATILRYEHTRPRVPLPAEGENIAPDEQILLQKIFTQLRARTNRDFNRYKRSTVLRRIARRMQINYLEDLPGYLERLRERPDEVVALADDLLITVTHFFRDTEVFEKLKKEVIPDLFSHKGAQESLRIWSVGCATGEEAYSLAMLLAEEAPRHQPSPQIQVFASDLHSRSLAIAREGLYSGDIETDVSPERLKRFFERENGGFRIHKEIRDLVVFTPHNLLSDPPFSRLDLISCRNLLIYLERNIQHDVLDLFHYALKPEGVLLMGSAETIDGPDLFRVDDKRLCIFRKRNVPAREPRLPVFPLVRQRLPGENGEEPGSIPAPMSYGMLHLGMVEQYAPPSILIGPDNRLVHLSEHAGRYLIHPGGEPTASALKLVREELRIELQASLQMVREKRVAYDSRPLPVRFDGHARPVVMHVRPALEPEREDFVLVIFEEREPHDPEDGAEAQTSDSRNERIAELENELLLTRQRLQAMIEEYETRREEMKASTEEMQSTNEELRSTMEELETSKEELQSINEELQTVNQQNRHKVEELAQLSSDLQNHLAATDIATLFLDRELRILRFTPRLGDIFNARVTDRGRPISDLTHRLGYDDLRADAEAVLSRLVPIEREVQDDAGRWYLTRVLPYRSTQDRIEGVVITFVDIDSRKRTEESLRRSEERLRRMVNAGVIGVLTFDEFGMLIDSNDTWLSMSGYTREEIGARKLNRRILTPGEYLQISDRQMQKLAATGSSDSYEKEYFRRDGSRIWLICTAAKIDDRTVIEYCIDISDRKRAEQRARDARLDADIVIEALHEPLLILSSDLTVRQANPAFCRHFEVEPADTVGCRLFDLGNGQWDISELRTLLLGVASGKEAFEDFEIARDFADIGRRILLVSAQTLRGAQLILLVVRDITERLRFEEQRAEILAKDRALTAERALRETEAELARVARALSVGELATSIAHEINQPLAGVVTNAEAGLRWLDSGKPNIREARESLALVVRDGNRASMVIRRIRDFLKKETRQSESLDMNEVAHEAIALVEAELTKLQINLKSDLVAPNPAVQGDRIQLQQVIVNLLMNAAEAMDSLTGPKNLQVSSRNRGDDSTIVVAVKDSGAGVNGPDLPKIFDAFFTTRGDGIGIGLSLSRSIVEAHGGHIWAETNHGSGLTVQFSLPVET